jgi:hypothetical protein
MSISDGEKNLLAAKKRVDIEDFNNDQTKKKACSLFHRYGTDLPASIIHFLRDEAGKYVKQEDSKKTHAKKESNKVLRECYIAINWEGMQPTRAYEKYSEILEISESAFQKRYLKKYPPGCAPLIFPDNLTLG